MLLGWERVSVTGGTSPFLVLTFDAYPISHSLVTLIGWGALFGLLYRARTGYGRGALVLVLAAGYVGSLFSPPPPGVTALPIGGILFGWLFVVGAWWTDRHRQHAVL